MSFSQISHENQTKGDLEYRKLLPQHFAETAGNALDKLENFTRYVPRQSIARFLAKSAIFEQILEVHGNIVEAGVFTGGGLFTWAQLSSILEPTNHNRKIIGFDSFEGLINPRAEDMPSSGKTDTEDIKGMYCFQEKKELEESIQLYDLNRSLGHIPKIELVEGDACKTIPDYVLENEHSLISLLYLDFDLYEPTKIALETFIPRMPKGAIVAFDELNQKQWPGETKALIETIGISNLEIKRFPYVPQISYAKI